MIFDKKGNTTLVTQESGSISVFIERLTASYPKLENDNIIINLFSLEKITVNEVLEFRQLSESHKKQNKSFVIVTEKINYDEIPESMVIVPTVQEAFDIIEMDEIERDLGF